MKISDKMDDILVTYSLGSCIGLSVYDPVAKVGGMVHCMLPLSKVDPAKAKTNPHMFTDISIPTLLEELFKRGATRNNLVVKVAGCSSLLDNKGLFKIGERNYTVCRKILWKNNILIDGEEVGGAKPRTLLLYMDSGRTTVKNAGTEVEI
ncbi:MAG: chemotaxis protein CheD [Bacteroidales bacterium]|nr:chemotaxis protein CheD [Candidatus Latescibacterota bacterium]